MIDGFAFVLMTITIFSIQIHPSTSIVGGNLVDIKEYPFFAYLSSSDNSIFCGGSIIARDLILTAAHCLDKEDIKVYVGVSSVDELKPSLAYKVKKRIPYPGFKNGKSWFDVGLVRLSKKIKLSHKVRIIPIASAPPKLEQITTVIGFGNIHCDISTTGVISCTKSTHLRSTQLKVANFGYRGTIKSFGKHSNICHGDSGGPMIYDGKVIGISATIDKVTCYGGCAFAPVFFNSHWIKKHIKHL